MNLLRWFLKELLKQTAWQISTSSFVAIVIGLWGWFSDFQEVRTKTIEVISILSPLIVLAVGAFVACMVTFTVLRLTLSSQRFSSDSDKILKTLNLVREFLDNRYLEKPSNPFLVFQSIEDLKNTVMKKHKIRYPSITPENEDYAPIWFVVLSNLHGLAVNADLKAARHMHYDLIDRKAFRELWT